MTKMPGGPVRGSKTGRPIMVLLDFLGQRWALRILWEIRNGRKNFRDLRSQCDDVSPTVLNKRLKELRELGLIDLADAGYGLTRHGAELTQLMAPLDKWANKWAKNRQE